MPSISSDTLPASTGETTARAARYALIVLLAVNLLNYLDRQVLYSLLPLIQGDLRINDAQAGRLASAFMIVYMLAAPPIGFLADRKGRKFWVSLGVGLWSVATAASGLAWSYLSLFGTRAAVGIGESCYGAISPSLVAEHYPPAKRASVLAYFSMAIPVGSAFGYIAGGVLGQRFGWRPAFWLVGAPGLLFAFLALRLTDPRESSAVKTEPAPTSALRGYARLFRVKSFTLVTLAMAAMTFGLGAFAVWMPTFFHRAWGLSVAQAGTLFGGITVVTGILGSLAGGWLSDLGLKFTSKSYLLVSGLGLLIGAPLAGLAVASGGLKLAVAAIFAAEFFLFLNMGPLNAVIVAVTPLSERSMAFAANILVIHALGDAISPAIVGSLSDRFGLRPALGTACFALAVASAFCFACMPVYDEDARHG